MRIKSRVSAIFFAYFQKPQEKMKFEEEKYAKSRKNKSPLDEEGMLCYTKTAFIARIQE